MNDNNTPPPSNRAKLAAGGMAAAVALAVPLIITFEGMINHGYRDPVGIATSCVGHVSPEVVVGRHYTNAECSTQLAGDLERTSQGIARCLPAQLPTPSRAAFVSFAFNVGPARFCGSSIARRLNAGDLRGACAGLSAYVFARGQRLPGLVRRRAAERALCERGLHP